MQKRAEPISFEPEKYNRAKRHNVLRSARIESQDGQFQMECVVTDISKTGMRVFVDNDQSVPDIITVFLINTETTHHCQVMRRSQGEIGVHIIG